MLRAIRRPNASGAPSRSSNGTTVTASAPPTPGGEGGDGAAQHVDPGVLLAGHRPAGDRVQRHLAGGPAGRLEHARPQPARRPELGDGRELLVGGREAELDQSRAVLDGEARVGEEAEVGDAGRDGPAELLRVAGSLVVQRRAVDHQRADAELEAATGDRREQVASRDAVLAHPGGQHLDRLEVEGEVRGGVQRALHALQEVGERLRPARSRDGRGRRAPGRAARRRAAWPSRAPSPRRGAARATWRRSRGPAAPPRWRPSRRRPRPASARPTHRCATVAPRW